MAEKLRIAMLASGGGTTVLEIIKACKSGRLKRVLPIGVIASREEAGVITKAEAEGLATVVINRRDSGSPEEFGEKIMTMCRAWRVDFIGQYGWMALTPTNVIEAYRGMMVNQHPGPLDPGYPDFGGRGMFGRRVHAARLYFVRRMRQEYWTEATAQRVDPRYDRGAVVHRETVPIQPEDDPISLQQRVLPVEHQVQIETLELFAENRVPTLVREIRLIDTYDVNEGEVLTDAKCAAALLFPRG